jgi:NAD+ kinase
MTDPTNQVKRDSLLHGGVANRPRVVVLAAPDRPKVQSELQRLRPVLEQHCELLAVDESFSYRFEGQDIDLVVVLGGDGSILQAARQMGHHQHPVLGVNLGRLGFLAALSPDQFIDCWPSVCRGSFAITHHLMLQCFVFQDGELIKSQIGLNEMAVLGGPPYSMLQIDLYVDSELATTYSCDGLIISTPIGSTAHNLSAGGPILRKNLQAFVISPISPHTLTMRPVVDTADREFELVVREHHPSTSVVVDGRVLCPLRPEHRVRVVRAQESFQLVNVPGFSDYVTLRDKLGWSGSPRGIRQ